MSSKIDLALVFYDSQEKVLIAPSDNVEKKALLADPRFIGMDDAVILTPREVAESKLEEREEAVVSQEKYDELQGLCNSKDLQVGSRDAEILELRSEIEELKSAPKEGGKKPRGRPKNKG